MRTTVKSTLYLGFIGLVSTLVLATIYVITSPRISKLEKEKETAALAAVLPGYTMNGQQKVSLKDGDFSYWTAEKDGARGYAFICESSGYSGPVRLMVGINTDLIIQGVSILQQSETPGLGARSTEIASKATFWDVILGKAADESGLRPWFQEQFTGINAGSRINVVKQGVWDASMREGLLEKNAISAITGATITSNAARNAVAAGTAKLQQALCSTPAAGTASDTVETTTSASPCYTEAAQ